MTPDCPCHGEPMRWEKDARKPSGGFWRCRIRRYQANLAWEHRNLAARQERQLRYWHKHDGGYIKRRRRHLADQRQAIHTRIAELEQEAVNLAVERHP